MKLLLYLHLLLDIVENDDTGDGINELPSWQQIQIRTTITPTVT